MEKIIYRLTLDTHKNGIQKTLQGFETADKIARRIAINLTSGSDTYDITDDVIAVMYVTTPDATEPSINECSIEGNTIIYDVLPIVEEGITEMQMKLISVRMNGAESVIASPKFAVEVTESGTSDSGAEQSTTFTALENAIAKANAVYNARLERVELDDNCIFRVYYADGTVYESDEIREEVHGYVDDSFRSTIESINKSVESAKASEDSAKRSMDNAYLSETFARTSEELAKVSENNAKTSEVKAKEYMEKAFSGTPEGYSALVEQVGLLDIAKSNDYTLYNSKQGGYRLNELVGATEQNGEPSPSNPIAIENTFDCVAMKQGYYAEGTGAYTLSTKSVCSKHIIPCKKGDQIRIRTEKTHKNIVIIYYLDGVYNSIVWGTTNVSANMGIVPSGVNGFTIRVTSENDITPQTVGKITLTVNGKYVGQIVELGRNELDYVDRKSGYLDSTGAVISDSTWFHKIVEVDSNYDYLINGTNSGSSPKICWFDSNMKFISYLNIANGLFTPPSNAKYFGVSFVGSNKNITVQKQKNTTFYLNEPLRATDRIVKVDGVLYEEHKKGNFVFDGSDDETWTYNAQYDGWYTPTTGRKSPSSKYTTNYICTHYKPVSNQSGWINQSNWISDSASNLWFDANGITDLATWKAQLQASPVTVEYERTTPTLTPLDTDSQLALNDMVTFDGMTYIEVDSKVKPTSISGEYGTSKVSALALENANLRDNLNFKGKVLKDDMNKLKMRTVCCTGELIQTEPLETSNAFVPLKNIDGYVAVGIVGIKVDYGLDIGNYEIMSDGRVKVALYNHKQNAVSCVPVVSILYVSEELIEDEIEE